MKYMFLQTCSLQCRRQLVGNIKNVLMRSLLRTSLFLIGMVFTKASYASWSSSCFSKEYARGWIRAFPDTIRLIPPPLAACNPEVVGSTPAPSIESKTVVFAVFFALQGCETQVKCTILRFSSCHSIWVALIAFRYSMKKKVSSSARPP